MITPTSQRDRTHQVQGSPTRRSAGRSRPSAATGTAPVDAPVWDAKRHTLTWGGQVVKHFKSEAPCQEAILAAFQAAGWEACITFEIDAADGVNGKDRLCDAIRNLNRSVRPHLHFSQEGNGSRLCWSAR